MSRVAGVVLAYHRIAAAGFDPQRLRVTPEHFAEQLDVVTTCYQAGALSSHRSWPLAARPRPTVAITLDDGYSDAWTTAVPLLRSRKLAATVFVSTGALDDPAVFWWDLLERCLFEPARLPRTLELRRGREHELFRFDDRIDRGAAHDDPSWTIESARDPDSRHRAYRRLHAALSASSPPRRRSLLESLCRWAGVEVAAAPGQGPLSASQVQALAGEPGIEVGAHTHTHERLSSLTPRAQLRELTHSRDAIAALTGERPAFVAYPFGTARDVTRATPWLARAAGYSGACMGCGGVVRVRSSPWSLPRVLAPDLGAADFERWLALLLRAS